jgi:hypothetical protein
MRELNTVDDIINFINENSINKLKWWQVAQIKFEAWAEFRLERILKGR